MICSDGSRGSARINLHLRLRKRQLFAGVRLAPEDKFVVFKYPCLYQMPTQAILGSVLVGLLLFLHA